MAHRIALMSSEVAPFAKTGGLADVAAGLAKYLQRSGHDVRTFMPGYVQINRSQAHFEPVPAVQDVPLAVGPHQFRFSLQQGRIPHSQAVVYLIECPALYARRSLYTFDSDEHVRFIAFTRAVFAACQHLAWSPAVMHCNDWHTGFAPMLLKHAYSWDRLFAATKSVLTIHNIGYQGVFAATALGDLARHQLTIGFDHDSEDAENADGPAVTGRPSTPTTAPKPVTIAGETVLASCGPPVRVGKMSGSPVTRRGRPHVHPASRRRGVPVRCADGPRRQRLDSGARVLTGGAR